VALRFTAANCYSFRTDMELVSAGWYIVIHGDSVGKGDALKLYTHGAKVYNMYLPIIVLGFNPLNI
jgi:hypothetical protein